MFIVKYLVLKNWPSTHWINNFRGKIYSKYFMFAGTNLQIGRSVNFANIQNIKIGDNVTINAETYLIASLAKIIIGNNVMIAPRCFLQTQNHQYLQKNKLISTQGVSYKDIIIEDDVWIGANSIILPGVIIKRGCVIAAGAVMTKNTEEYGLYAGNPAKRIKERI